MSNGDGKFVATIDNDFHYFDMLPKEIREIIASFPRKIAAYPVFQHYQNMVAYSPYSEEKIIAVLREGLEKAK